MYLILITTLLMFQTQPPIRNPNVPRNDKPPGTGNTMPPNGNQLPNGNQPGTGVNVMVDGMYTILAYEKFGQVLPGMANLKVVIRNNIMTFPGDTKTPGKMLQLNFGPGNTITVTPLDGRGPNPWQQPPVNQTGANTNAGQTGTINQAGGNNTTGQGNATNQAGGQPPVIPPINNQTGAGQNNIMAPPANSESGVYVLSNEFFSISIASQFQSPLPNSGGTDTRNQNPGGTVNQNQNPPSGNNQPPVNNQDPATNNPNNNNNGQVMAPRNPAPVPSQAVLVLRRVAN